jgi:hypothetical protein
MSFTQLNPSIPLNVLGKGHAEAIAVIDYGPEHDLLWVSILDSNGEIWCVPNKDVRGIANYSIGRHLDNKPT